MLGHDRALVSRDERYIDDAMGLIELEQIVEQREHEALVELGVEDLLEDQIGLGVGDDGSTGVIIGWSDTGAPPIRAR